MSLQGIGNIDNLKSLNDDGSAPVTRVCDATSVRNMWAAVSRAYERRQRTNSLVAGLVDGNPPWPNQAPNGQRYKANFNNGEAQAYLESAVTTFYDLFSEAGTYATVTVDSMDPNAADWASTLTQNFQWLLKQDCRMDFNHQVSIGETVMYGIGPQVFQNRLDWRATALPARRLYVPDDAPSDVYQWPWCMIQYDYDVGDLYEFISDPEFADSQGWDVEAVKQSIILAKPSQWSNTAWNQWQVWQEKLRTNSIWMSEQCRKVRCVQLLVKEFSVDGKPPKISEYWVDVTSGSSDSNFLMKRESSYESFEEFITAGYYDRGSSGLHQSVKGLGVKMYALLTTRMRLQLAAVDAAFASSTVFLTSNAPAGRNTLSNVEFGAFTVLPQGLALQPGNLQGTLQPAIEMSGDMENTLNRNLSQYRQRLDSGGPGNPSTAFEVKASLAQGATLGKSQISRYYFQLDALYSEQFKRAANKDLPQQTTNHWLKLALEFQKRCKDAGVPDKAFENCVVKATRIAGQGSPFLRGQALNQVYATVFPSLPPDGQKRLIHDLVAASVGPDLASRYMPTQQVSQDAQAEDVWEAQMENLALHDGGGVNLTPEQNDVVHLTEHFKSVNEGMQSLQDPQGDLHSVFNTLVSLRAHIAQHLQRLSANPMQKQAVQQFRQLFDQLNQAIEHAQAILEQQAKQAAQQQQQIQDAQPKMDAATMLAQNKVQNDRLKTQSHIEIKQTKAQQDMEIQRAKAQQTLGIQAAEASQKLSHNEVETVQSLEINAAKTHQDLVSGQISNIQSAHAAAIENAAATTGAAKEQSAALTNAGNIARQVVKNQASIVPIA
jgi:hypothetical protein